MKVKKINFKIGIFFQNIFLGFIKIFGMAVVGTFYPLGAAVFVID